MAKVKSRSVSRRKTRSVASYRAGSLKALRTMQRMKEERELDHIESCNKRSGRMLHHIQRQYPSFKIQLNLLRLRMAKMEMLLPPNPFLEIGK